MFIAPDDLLKLILAVIAGGLIGFEREIHNKAAGLRTIALICLGSTLFTILSENFGDDRVVANIVTGIGFLGAGVIMFSEGRVKGLTTASAVWIAAAIGMAIGMDQYELAAVVVLLALIVLWGFARFDKWLESRGRETRLYEIAFARAEKIEGLAAQFKQCGLKTNAHKEFKQGDVLLSQWTAYGKISAHEQLVRMLLDDENVRELRY
jgi:putative Mg2+ transporter-C (MgtC) family protein